MTATSTRTRSGAWRGTDVLRVWVTFSHRDANGAPKDYLWSGIPIAHASTRYGGYKDARVIKYGQWTTARSDHWGRLESSSFSFTISDYANEVRAFFDNVNQAGLWQTRVTVYELTVADDLSGQNAAVRFQGVVQDYTAETDFEFTFVCCDTLSALISQPPPLRPVAIDYPGAPTTSQGLYLPICLGPLSDEGSSVAAPTPVAETVDGSGATATTAGYGHLPGSPPVSLTGTPQAQSGGSPGNAFGVAHNAEGGYWVLAWTITAGLRSDPIDFLAFTTGGSSFIDFSSAPTFAQLAASVPVVAGVDGYGFATGEETEVGTLGHRWEQIIEGPSNSVVFDQTPHNDDDPIDPVTMASGAVPPLYAADWEYLVTAVYGGVETTPSSPVRAQIGPYVRPVRFAWTFAGSPDAFNVYRRPTGGAVDRVQRVLPTAVNGDGHPFFLDDQSGSGWTMVSGIGGSSGGVGPQGRCPCVPIGSFNDLSGNPWQGFALAAHGVALPLLGLYLTDTSVSPPVTTRIPSSRFNLDVSVPGETGFLARWGAPYRDTPAGGRTVVIYLTGADASALLAATKILSVNISGPDAVGDCSGAPVADVTAWLKLFILNYVLASYVGGNWITGIPTWPDGTPQIDDASFTAAQTAIETVFTNPTRAMRIADPTSRALLDLIAAVTVEIDCSYMQTKQGQVRLRINPPDPAEPPASFTVDERLDVIKKTIKWKDLLDTSRFYSNTPYTFGPAYDATGGDSAQGTGLADNAVNRTTYANGFLLVASEALNLITIWNPSAASQLMVRRVARASKPTRQIMVRVPLYLIEPDPGDIGAVTHRQGTGVGGWVGRRTVLHRLSPLLDLAQVDHELWDIDDEEFADMIAGQIEFLGGDGSAAISVGAYPTGASAILPDTEIWTVDSANLPGTYLLQGMGIVAGGTLKIGLFNLDDAPNAPLVELTFTNTSALTAPAVSSLITFASAGIPKHYGLKGYMSVAGTGFNWTNSVRRVS